MRKMIDIKSLLKIGISLQELKNIYGDPIYDDYFMGGKRVLFDEKIGCFLTKENKVAGFTTANPNVKR